MDPISAVSLAAAIVAFVDFSWKLLSTAQTIHTSPSGLTAEHEELHDITKNLIRLDDDLTAVTGIGAIPDSLRDLSGHCKEVAEELREILRTLQIKNPHPKWKSFIQAMRSVCKKDQIESLARRMDRLKAEMHLQISVVLLTENSSINKALSALVLENERLSINDAQQLEGQIKGVHQAIAQLQLEIDDSKSAIMNAIQSIKSSNSSDSPILPEGLGSMQELSKKLSLLANDVNVTASNHQVLSSLWSPILGERKENVATAHEKTFSWLFNPDSPSRFEPWLKGRNGVYWVMGKAGSGKSTLMKFLLNHPKTSQLLKAWAGDQELVVTSFFLWRAGAALQKSQEGLYRSLLFAILRQCPDLIQYVCASKLRTFRPYENKITAWTLSELGQALKEVQFSSGTRARFCFFIDGLDEYDGEAEQMVEILENLANWKMVKICASSRPWNEFIDAFGRPNDPQLALEDLTQRDIELYIQDRLGRNKNFKALSSQDDRCQQLVLEIVQKARGVFLWVELVVKSLLTGLRNADRISDLQRRLQDFPPTLEEYFSKMLKSIDPIYRQQTAEAFEFALKAIEPLSLTTYSFLDEETHDGAPSRLTTSFTPDELLERHEIMKKRLNGRSKGLLEVARGTEISRKSVGNLILQPKVDFLHRTAHDFLHTRDLQLMMKDNLRPDFNPSLCFIRSFLLQAQRLPKNSKASLDEIFKDVTSYAFRLEQESSYDHFPLLDQMVPLGKPGTNFLNFCVHGCLHQYVTSLMNRPGMVSQSTRHKLLALSLGFRTGSDRVLNIDSKMVSILVEHGASPKAKTETSYYDGGRQTIWERFLFNLDRSEGPDLDEQIPAVLTILLSHGANDYKEVQTGQEKLPGPKAGEWRGGRMLRRDHPSYLGPVNKSAREIMIGKFGRMQAESIIREASAQADKAKPGISFKGLRQLFNSIGTKR